MASYTIVFDGLDWLSFELMPCVFSTVFETREMEEAGPHELPGLSSFMGIATTGPAESGM